jgi:hypothetical protein
LPENFQASRITVGTSSESNCVSKIFPLCVGVKIKKIGKNEPLIKFREHPYLIKVKINYPKAKYPKPESYQNDTSLEISLKPDPDNAR